MRKNLLFGLVLVVGCGGRTPLSPQELCEGIQKAHCAKLYQCATTPAAQAALQLLYASQDDCVMQGINMQHPVCSQWTEANVCGQTGVLTYSGDAAANCVSDLNALDCAKTLTAVVPDSCTPGSYCQ